MQQFVRYSCLDNDARYPPAPLLSVPPVEPTPAPFPSQQYLYDKKPAQTAYTPPASVALHPEPRGSRPVPLPSIQYASEYSACPDSLTHPQSTSKHPASPAPARCRPNLAGAPAHCRESLRSDWRLNRTYTPHPEKGSD